MCAPKHFKVLRGRGRRSERSRLRCFDPNKEFILNPKAWSNQFPAVGNGRDLLQRLSDCPSAR